MRTLSLLALGVLIAAPAAIAQEPQKGKLEAVKAEARKAVDSAKWSDAIASYRKALEIDPKDATSWHMLGYSLHAAGKLEEALKVHVKATEFPEVAPIAAYNVACVHALKGDKDEAFKWLQKSVSMGFNQPDQLASDPDMDSLRDDPRFKKIADAMEGGGSAVQVYAYQTKRASARVAYFSSTGSPGQIVIDYGQPVWKSEYSKQIDSPKMTNRRWRFGQDFWTNMDSTLDMKIGGVKVPAGYYYLTLEHKGDHKFVIAFNDAATVKKSKLDAYVAHMTKGGIEVPLTHKEVDEVADALQIGVKMHEGSKDSGELVVHFGPHRLTADVAVAVK